MTIIVTVMIIKFELMYIIYCDLVPIRTESGRGGESRAHDS